MQVQAGGLKPIVFYPTKSYNETFLLGSVSLSGENFIVIEKQVV